MDRGRSRSPISDSEATGALQALGVARRGKRGGKSYKRILKGACLRVLRAILNQLFSVVCSYEDQGLAVPSNLDRRRNQLEVRIQEIIAGDLPHRDQPVLPQLSDSDIDSELKEEVWISSDEGEQGRHQEEPSASASSGSRRPPEPAGPPPGWRPPEPAGPPPKAAASSRRPPEPANPPSALRSSRPKVPAAPRGPPLAKASRNPYVVNASDSSSSFAKASGSESSRIIKAKSPVPSASVPKESAIVLRPKAKAAASSIVRVPWGEIARGTVITPSEPQIKISGKVLVSLDWHQVLDVKRHSRGADRPWPEYTLLPEYEALIRSLKEKGVELVVCSYTHSPFYRDSVQSLSSKYPGLFTHVITTEQRCERGGKLHALLTIAHLSSCKVIHCDDAEEIVAELDKFAQYRNWPLGHPVGVTPVGIKAPRKRQHPGARYFKNLTQALEQLDVENLQQRLDQHLRGGVV